MARNPTPVALLATIRDTIVVLMQSDTPGLSALQTAIFLTCALEDRDHTVRGLAAELNVSKPTITRSLD